MLLLVNKRGMIENESPTLPILFYITVQREIHVVVVGNSQFSGGSRISDHVFVLNDSCSF